MAKNIERYFLDVIYCKEKGLRAEFLRKILYVLSRIYKVIVQIRYQFYRHGIFRRKTLGCLIISIGNITVGGTGKTPLVEMFARALSENGRKVAILSRGYKRKKNFRFVDLFDKERWSSTPDTVSDGAKVIMDSKDAGDEPFMLARNLNGVVVLVGKNRVKSGSYAIEKYGVDTLILDDGFQYLPLNRRLDIVLIDATNPFGNDHLLPRGILREPLRHLARANIFFITKAKDIPTDKIKERLKRFNSKAEIVECYYEPKHLIDLCSGGQKDLGYLNGKNVAVVTAIADPEGFENLVGKQLGGNIVSTFKFPDHYRFTVNDIEAIENSLPKKADAIITTEKDSVRFPADIRRKIPVYYVKIEVKIISGARDFNDCVARLCNN